MANEIYLTKAGYKQLDEELDNLIKVKRPEMAERVKLAREFGDLSENAEYDAAKDEQGMVEGKIRELEATLKNAILIDDKEINTKAVSVGCTVKLLDIDYDETVEYQIVGTAEANYTEGKISNQSLLGAALLGKSVNTVVEVKAPAGIGHYKIIKIGK
ncbi:MAG: transcription elongation factor GreA [Clostridia bacterium]|nr:transcription elongation factor GreA [Clostridia bacterium]